MKTKTAHTPGPWIANDHLKNGQWQILGQEYTISNDLGDYVRPVIVSVMGGGNRPFYSEAEANARLIAAAPETAAERDRLKEINKELLENLKALMERISAYRLNHNASFPALAENSERLRSARVAIAKAEARS